MAMNSVGWFEIYVKDMPRAKAFYEAVFDRKMEKLGESGAPGISDMWVFPGKSDNAGATGALVKMENGPSGVGVSSSISFATIVLSSPPALSKTAARS
jgi:uncharacterized protein